MHDPLQNGFCLYVKLAATAFPVLSNPARPLNYYTASEPGEFTPPCVSFEAGKSAPLHANTTVCEGPLTVWLESQINDTTEDDHEAMKNALVSILSQRKAAVSFLNALTNGLRAYGYRVEAITSELKNNRWTSSVVLKVGYWLPPGA